jgi:hypothetical protein
MSKGHRGIVAWVEGTHDYFEMLVAHRRRGVEPSNVMRCGVTAPRFGPAAESDPTHDDGSWTCALAQTTSTAFLSESFLECQQCWLPSSTSTPIQEGT